jgi:hypothetical protein
MPVYCIFTLLIAASWLRGGSPCTEFDWFCLRWLSWSWVPGGIGDGMFTVCGTVTCGGEWLCTGMVDWVWSVDRGGIVKVFVLKGCYAGWVVHQ